MTRDAPSSAIAAKKQKYHLDSWGATTRVASRTRNPMTAATPNTDPTRVQFRSGRGIKKYTAAPPNAKRR